MKPATPEEKCYWVDAVCLAEAFNARFPWLREMDGEEKGGIMQDVKDRMDFLTITGSLNQELKDTHY